MSKQLPNRRQQQQQWLTVVFVLVNVCFCDVQLAAKWGFTRFSLFRHVFFAFYECKITMKRSESQCERINRAPAKYKPRHLHESVANQCIHTLSRLNNCTCLTYCNHISTIQATSMWSSTRRRCRRWRRERASSGAVVSTPTIARWVQFSFVDQLDTLNASVSSFTHTHIMMTTNNVQNLQLVPSKDEQSVSSDARATVD